MNGAEETQDGCSVSDLQGLNESEEIRGVLLRENHAIASDAVVEFPGQVDGGDGGCKVGKCAGKAHVVRFSWDTSKGKCVFDGVLLFVSMSDLEGLWGVSCAYHIVLHARHHVHLILWLFCPNFGEHGMCRTGARHGLRGGLNLLMCISALRLLLPFRQCLISKASAQDCRCRLQLYCSRLR
jgi:hypothetical protein